jgi:hypothetical protein
MAFYTFQLASIAAQNIRSRTTDIDLLTFGVLVNGRDQGHGYSVVPMWPRTVLKAQDIEKAAAINGHPYGKTHMSKDWVIGPLRIEDGDDVSIVYTASNTSDSNLPSAEQREVDEWTVKVLNVYYSMLVGSFVSGLGLTAVAEFIGANVSSATAAFFADPVGTILGVEPTGPCNGTVFADAKAFTGASLRQLSSSQSQKTQHGVTLNTASSELKYHYSDEATHDKETCGDTAQTDVTLEVRRYDYWSMRFASNPKWSLSSGIRRDFPNGGTFSELYGLRI